uniref:Uncharacterized protein n=1 Tax=Romanomermis culicivorax TaxID=13658 RepID=A0A915K4B2_ROMCU
MDRKLRNEECYESWVGLMGHQTTNEIVFFRNYLPIRITNGTVKTVLITDREFDFRNLTPNTIHVYCWRHLIDNVTRKITDLVPKNNDMRVDIVSDIETTIIIDSQIPTCDEIEDTDLIPEMRQKPPMDLSMLISNNLSNLEPEEDEEIIARLSDMDLSTLITNNLSNLEPEEDEEIIDRLSDVDDDALLNVSLKSKDAKPTFCECQVDKTVNRMLECDAQVAENCRITIKDKTIENLANKHLRKHKQICGQRHENGSTKCPGIRTYFAPTFTMQQLLMLPPIYLCNAPFNDVFALPTELTFNRRRYHLLSVIVYNSNHFACIVLRPGTSSKEYYLCDDLQEKM